MAEAQGSPCWVTFVDLRKAYDSVPHWVIAQSLKAVGFTEATIATILRIYMDNTAQVITPWGLMAPQRINIGVRQGDPLSPVLFNIVLDQILHQLEAIPGCTILAYADDICIITADQQTMQVCVATLDQEGGKQNLWINGGKSGFMVVNGPPHHPPWNWLRVTFPA